jgi:Uma2 family endonuclease
MGAVTMPWGRALEYEDLESIPDDGHRYELVDGALLVTPAPGFGHQRAVKRLLRLIDDACPPDLEALAAPFDVVLSSSTVFEPDVLIARLDDISERNLPVPPVLAVEVLSPSTRSIDRVLKYSRYAESGVEHYWIVDPEEPSLTAYRLGLDGTYEQVAHVIGDLAYEAFEPVHVVVVPSRLVRRG